MFVTNSNENINNSKGTDNADVKEYINKLVEKVQKQKRVVNLPENFNSIVANKVNKEVNIVVNSTFKQYLSDLRKEFEENTEQLKQTSETMLKTSKTFSSNIYKIDRWNDITNNFKNISIAVAMIVISSIATGVAINWLISISYWSLVLTSLTALAGFIMLCFLVNILFKVIKWYDEREK